jgi:hypothetical protein
MGLKSFLKGIRKFFGGCCKWRETPKLRLTNDAKSCGNENENKELQCFEM